MKSRHPGEIGDGVLCSPSPQSALPVSIDYGGNAIICTLVCQADWEVAKRWRWGFPAIRSMKEQPVGDLETRVAKALANAVTNNGMYDPEGNEWEHWLVEARTAIAAVREWDKEQASAAVRAEHEGNRTIEGRGWKQLSGFKTNDGWTNL